MCNGEWRVNTTSTDRVFLDAVAINRTLDDIVTQDLYEEWRDLGLLDRLYPEDWKQMIQHRVEQAAKERASGDNE